MNCSCIWNEINSLFLSVQNWNSFHSYCEADKFCEKWTNVTVNYVINIQMIINDKICYIIGKSNLTVD